MDLVIKILSFVAAMMACVELLPESSQKRLNTLASEKLTTKNALSSIACYLLLCLAVSAFLHWSAYIIAGVFVVLVGTLFTIMKNGGLWAGLEGRLFDAIAGWALGLTLFLGGFYIIVLISIVIPFERLDFLFYPLEYLSRATESSPLAWMTPDFSPSHFRNQFTSVNSEIMSWAGVEQISTSKWRYVSWHWLYMNSSQFFSWLALIIVMLAWLCGTLFLALFIACLFLYPLFQASLFIKRRSRPNKQHIPIMAILIGVVAAFIGLFT